MRAAHELKAAARYVTVCTPDTAGRLIGKRRLIADWPKLCEHGMMMPDFHLITNIDNRPQSGFGIAGLRHGFRNGRLMPDVDAAFVSPLENETMFVLADPLSADRTAIAQAPRAILKAQIERLRAAGITLRAASELEFYVMRHSYTAAHGRKYASLDPLYHRHGDNDVLVAGLATNLCDGVQQALESCGMVVDQFQGEGGAGQFEVNIAPDLPLRAADNHAVFKHIVKAAAHKAELSATFLAKPFETDAGSGGHIHMSFWTEQGGNALGTAGSLSRFGEHFLAGLLAHAPELTLLHAPYANSYKRLVPGSFTPILATWAWESRTAMVRLVSGVDGPRLEFRLPGADANPYHVYSAIIAAGLAGVEGRLALPPEATPGDGDAGAPVIPADLTEAVARFAGSDLARQAFGESVHGHLLGHARHELAAVRRAVTDWEIARGFENA